MPSTLELDVQAFSVIFAHPDWWKLPVSRVVGMGVKATNGAADWVRIRDLFVEAVRERGMEPNLT